MEHKCRMTNCKFDPPSWHFDYEYGWLYWVCYTHGKMLHLQSLPESLTYLADFVENVFEGDPNNLMQTSNPRDVPVNKPQTCLIEIRSDIDAASTGR